MSKHDDLLQQGPREAPEPETAEQRTKRLGGAAAGGIAAGGLALAKLGFLAKFLIWIFAWHGVVDLWRIGGWIAIRWTGSGLTGLASVAAAGMIVYGGLLAIAFRGNYRALAPKPR